MEKKVDDVLRIPRRELENQDVRREVYDKGFYLYEVAEHLGISQYTLNRWLRKPLTTARRKAVLDAVKEMWEDKVMNG